MTDVLVTIPRRREAWERWLAEGDAAGEPWSGREHGFRMYPVPNIEIGERVYVAWGGLIRGYALLLRIERIFVGSRWRTELVRGGDARAVTLMCMLPERCECPWRWDGPHPTLVGGARYFRYRWWDRADEWALPSWKTATPLRFSDRETRR